MAKKQNIVGSSNEPTFSPEQVADAFTLIRAMNWYHNNKSDADAAKYLGVKNISIAKSNLTYAWLKRMRDRGAVFPDTESNAFDRLKERFTAQIKQISDSKKESEDNVVSIQDRVQAKVDYFTMELEGKFDELWFDNSTQEFVPYTWMVDNEVKPMHAAKIAEYCREQAKEWVKIIEDRKKDEYVKESYPRPSKEYLRAVNIWLSFATDAEKLANNQKAARKPRKKKPVSQEKKISKIKYQVEDVDLKLTSINPIKIIGSQQLWVYNTKTRKLGVYNAADESGLSVKGSSILNYNESTSISKTLRKPEKTLKDITSVGKVGLRKAMETINSKPVKLNGRINNLTILVRVV